MLDHEERLSKIVQANLCKIFNIQDRVVTKEKATNDVLLKNGYYRASSTSGKEVRGSVETLEDTTVVELETESNILSNIEDLRVLLDLSFNGSLTLLDMECIDRRLNMKGKTKNGVFGNLDRDVNIHILHTGILEGKMKPYRDVCYHQPYFTDKVVCNCWEIDKRSGQRTRTKETDLSSTTGINLLWLGSTASCVNNMLLHKGCKLNLKVTSNHHGECLGVDELCYKRTDRPTPWLNMKWLEEFDYGSELISYFLYNNYSLINPSRDELKLIERNINTKRLVTVRADEEKKRTSNVTPPTVKMVVGEPPTENEVLREFLLARGTTQDAGMEYTIENEKLDNTVTSQTNTKYLGKTLLDVYAGPYIVNKKSACTKSIEQVLDKRLTDEIVNGCMNKSILLLPRVSDDRWCYQDTLPHLAETHRLKSPCENMDRGKMMFLVSEEKKKLYVRDLECKTVSEVRHVGLNPYLRYLRSTYRNKTYNPRTGKSDVGSIEELERRIKNLVGNKLFSIEFFRYNFSNTDSHDLVLQQFLQEDDDKIYLEIEGEVLTLDELEKMRSRVAGIDFEPTIGESDHHYREGTFKILQGVRDAIKERELEEAYVSLCFYKVRTYRLEQLQGGSVYVDRVARNVYAWEQDIENLKRYLPDMKPYCNMGLILVNNHNPNEVLYTNFYGYEMKLEAKVIPKLKNGVYRILGGEYIRIEKEDYEAFGIVDDPRDVGIELLADRRKEGKKVLESILKESLDVEWKRRDLKHQLEVNKLTGKNIELSLNNTELKSIISRLKESDQSNFINTVNTLKAFKDMGVLTRDIYKLLESAIF